jgi:hypothetical protein
VRVFFPAEHTTREVQGQIGIGHRERENRGLENRTLEYHKGSPPVVPRPLKGSATRPQIQNQSKAGLLANIGSLARLE